MGGGRESGGGARAQWNSERVSEALYGFTLLERAAQGCEAYVHVIRGMDHECDGFYSLQPTHLTPHTSITHSAHTLEKTCTAHFYRIGGSVSISGAPALTLNVGNISGADLMVGTGLPKPMLL